MVFLVKVQSRPPIYSSVPMPAREIQKSVYESES
jgi:hypothetical protein